MKNRHEYLGASDAAGVLGLSRWSSPLKVWAEKTGAIEPENLDEKLAVWLGNQMEETVAQYFEKKTGKKVEKHLDAAGEPDQHVHPTHPFIRCHVDRLVVGEDAVLQCKTANPRKKKEWEGEEIPHEYIVQEQHELMVTGRRYAYIACLFGNEHFEWKRIERDEELIREMLFREVYFWNNFVVPRVPPETLVASDAGVLSRLFPQGFAGKSIVLPPNGVTIAEGIKSIELERDRMDEIIDQQKNELRMLLGDAEIAESDLFRVTWKNGKRSGLDVDRMKIDAPEIYDRFLKTSLTRTLRITKKK